MALMGCKLKWANLASVLIGFMGAKYVSALIKNSIGKNGVYKC